MPPDTLDNANKAARTSQFAAVGAVLTFIACNGVIFLIALFSAIGITLVISPHIQALVISLFALITLTMVFIAFRKNRIPGPLILCAVGAVIVIGTMYIHYDKIIESAGLLVLFVSALWSWRVSQSG
jgi:hypothetical protein